MSEPHELEERMTLEQRALAVARDAIMAPSEDELGPTVRSVRAVLALVRQEQEAESPGLPLMNIRAWWLSYPPRRRAMDELIARLEAATEEDWELNADIARAIGWKYVRTKSPNGPWMQWFDHDGHIMNHLRNWTGSIDAALTLVKEDYRWEISLSERWGFSAFVEPTTGGRFLKDTAPSPALALCIAALKARSHTAPQEK